MDNELEELLKALMEYIESSDDDVTIFYAALGDGINEMGIKIGDIDEFNDMIEKVVSVGNTQYIDRGQDVRYGRFFSIYDYSEPFSYN